MSQFSSGLLTEKASLPLVEQKMKRTSSTGMPFLWALKKTTQTKRSYAKKMYQVKNNVHLPSPV